MQRYILQRLALFVPTLLLASLMIFGAMRILPGDVALAVLATGGETAVTPEAVQEMRERLGLNKPLPVQYGEWTWSMVKGDFGGKSLLNREPIGSIVARRLPVTLQLTLYTMVFAMVVSVPLGIAAAVYQDKWLDYVIRIVAVLGLAVPQFWVAYIMLIGMAFIFTWSPPILYSNVWENPGDHFLMMMWPVLILSWVYGAYLIRITRSTMLEVLRQDYIRTARSKGLAEGSVLWRHGLRNALIPVLTLAGLYVGTLVGGTVILEAVFGLPGVGQAIIEAAAFRDYAVIQSLTMVVVFMMLSINLAVDIAYAFIDPRISYK